MKALQVRRKKKKSQVDVIGRVDPIGTSNKEEKVRSQGWTNQASRRFSNDFGGPARLYTQLTLACNNTACFLPPLRRYSPLHASLVPPRHVRSFSPSFPFFVLIFFLSFFLFFSFTLLPFRARFGWYAPGGIRVWRTRGTSSGGDVIVAKESSVAWINCESLEKEEKSLFASQLWRKEFRKLFESMRYLDQFVLWSSRTSAT